MVEPVLDGKRERVTRARVGQRLIIHSNRRVRFLREPVLGLGPAPAVDQAPIVARNHQTVLGRNGGVIYRAPDGSPQGTLRSEDGLPKALDALAPEVVNVRIAPQILGDIDRDVSVF